MCICVCDCVCICVCVSVCLCVTVCAFYFYVALESCMCRGPLCTTRVMNMPQVCYKVFMYHLHHVRDQSFEVSRQASVCCIASLRSGIHVALKPRMRADLSCAPCVTGVLHPSHTYIMCIKVTFRRLSFVACVLPFADALGDRPRRPFENIRVALYLTSCGLAT